MALQQLPNLITFEIHTYPHSFKSKEISIALPVLPGTDLMFIEPSCLSVLQPEILSIVSMIDVEVAVGLGVGVGVGVILGSSVVSSISVDGISIASTLRFRVISLDHCP
jgi:hypothetical protein